MLIAARQGGLQAVRISMVEVAAQPMVDYFPVFEEGCNRFPGFSYEVQGIYQVADNGRVTFYTYVVKD